MVLAPPPHKCGGGFAGVHTPNVLSDIFIRVLAALASLTDCRDRV